jgi:crotonobetainyl-CoA:carnitine CoA-transferase CaiB-like acyl-CoA transferase
MGARNANREVLKQMVTEALRGHTKAEWTEILNAGTVSCGPINEMADLERDPHVQARELVVSQQHPVNGRVKTAASPMRFSASPTAYRLAPPLTGEHTDEILREWLQLDERRIAELHKQQTI